LPFVEPVEPRFSAAASFARISASVVAMMNFPL
jgi:hypothetical protein